MTHIPDNPAVRGAKVWLRPITVDDADLWSEGSQDKNLAHLMGFHMPESLDFSKKQFDDEFIKTYGKNSYTFVICPLGSDERLGLIGLHSIYARNGTGEFFVFISDSAARGKGYGSDAVNALLDFAFGELSMARVSLHVKSFNERAIKLYQALGFVHEGTLRRILWHRGQRHDMHIMAILREEWEALSRPKAWQYD